MKPLFVLAVALALSCPAAADESAWTVPCPETVEVWAQASEASRPCQAGWFNKRLTEEATRCSFVLSLDDYSRAETAGRRAFDAHAQISGRLTACLEIFRELPNYLSVNPPFGER